MSFDPVTVALYVLALVPAVVLHEVSHGVVADRLGDPTPRRMGRLTLNPIRHVDPFGTVILPGLLLLPALFGREIGLIFGYAKPMPVDTANLKDPDRQMLWIAAAGPLTNLLLAVVGGVLFRFLGGTPAAVVTGTASLLVEFAFALVLVNVILAVFNIMPIPPLDGSKVLARFLPPRAREVYRSWEAYGALFILVLFFLFPGPVFAIVNPVVGGLLELLLS